jgi:hypothetical protein
MAHNFRVHATSDVLLPGVHSSRTMPCYCVTGLLVELEREDGAGPGHERAPGEGGNTVGGCGGGAI